MRTPALILAALVPLGSAMAEMKHFADAAETDEELIGLHDQAGDLCLRNPSRDVKIVVACNSMTIYGMALNERGWCRGREGEANAVMEWHACEDDSLRFPKVELPAGLR